MTLLAAYLNDAGISVLDADSVLYREPGFALLDDERLTTGSEAFSQARIKPRCVQNQFWFDLQTTPLVDRRFRHLSAADLVSRQLEQIWSQVASTGDELIVAVPAYMSNEHMGLLLGIAKELKIPIVAMVDAAVAATRREYKDAVPVHIDVSLHTALLTRAAQSGQAQVDRSVVIDDSGIMSLHDAWIHIIAEAFVQQSRFDPLHTAETEQALQDRLSDWIAAAAIGETITLDFAYRGVTHKAELESLEFIAAAAPVYHRIVGSLRALFQAHEVPALQLSDRVGRMPGPIGPAAALLAIHDEGVVVAPRHLDAIESLGHGADLVQFDENGIS